MARNYWMFVAPPENFDVVKERGFTVYGLGRRYRRRAERMQPDDRVLFYVTGLRKWTATASITSRFFEDHSPLWTTNNRGEVYPYRVRLAPDIVLDEADYVDALILAPRLEYVKRWAPEDWPLAFYDKLHLLPQRDFRLIEGEMKRTVSKANRGRNSRRPAYRSARTDGDAAGPSTQAEPQGVAERATVVEPQAAAERSTHMEPSGAAEPNTVDEPQVTAEFSTHAEPQGAAEPSTEVEPQAAAEPAAHMEPSAAAEPNTVDEPQVTAGPSTQGEPKGAAQPFTRSESQGGAGPSTQAEPQGAAEPSAEVEPRAAAEPAAYMEPSGAAEPNTVDEPQVTAEFSTQGEPEGAAQPFTQVEPQADAEPSTHEEPRRELWEKG